MDGIRKLEGKIVIRVGFRIENFRIILGNEIQNLRCYMGTGGLNMMMESRQNYQGTIKLRC